jgi:hypothetical protein
LIRRRVALSTTHDLLIYGQKYSRLARLSLSQFSLFLPFASSLHLPLAAVACSANELLYQLSHISISVLILKYDSHLIGKVGIFGVCEDISETFNHISAFFYCAK